MIKSRQLFKENPQSSLSPSYARVSSILTQQFQTRIECQFIQSLTLILIFDVKVKIGQI